MALPHWHLLAALPPAALAAVCGQPRDAAVFLTATVVVDIDYLVDWCAHGGREDYTRYLFRPLHGWETAALLALASCRWPAWTDARSLLAGAVCHLALDHLVHRQTGQLQFVMTWRAFSGFRYGASPVKVPRRAPAWRELALAAAAGGLLLLTSRSRRTVPVQLAPAPRRA